MNIIWVNYGFSKIYSNHKMIPENDFEFVIVVLG